MKITHAKLSSPTGHRGKRLVTVCAELGSPNEYLTITVAVANDGTEQDIRESGIAKARDYARQFSEVTPAELSDWRELSRVLKQCLCPRNRKRFAMV